MSLDALSDGHVAVITGGASGIGLAAARAFAARGVRIAIADRPGPRLEEATASLGDRAVPFPTDVADREAARALAAAVAARFGRVDVVMANAAIQPGSDIADASGNWDRVVATNLGGVVNTVQAFLSLLDAGDGPGLVICTGSKQGITTPPGDPAYNVAKAGVKAFAEALAHHYRNWPGRAVGVHLLIPGFVWTPLTQGSRTEKPHAAWTPEQTVAFMLERVEAGDFYILCPDNDVTRPVDEKRIAWAAGDIVENRPPLSRWHPDWAEKFRAFLEGE